MQILRNFVLISFLIVFLHFLEKGGGRGGVKVACVVAINIPDNPRQERHRLFQSALQGGAGPDMYPPNYHQEVHTFYVETIFQTLTTCPGQLNK